MLRFELRMACTRREWPLSELRRLESLHQKQTIATYERPKPKHHHRMHISEQGTRLGLLLDTEASEAKHQAYKASLADRMGNVSDWTQLQKGILCRLLQEQMDEMNEQLPFRTGLLNTTSNVSRSARTPHLCTVTVGDILLPLPLLPASRRRPRSVAASAGARTCSLRSGCYIEPFASSQCIHICL